MSDTDIGDSVRIVEVPIERLDEVEPVWRTLHDHHVSLEHDRHARIRDARQTWELRREDFRHQLATPDAFLVIAEDAATQPASVAGFAVVHLRDNDNWRVHGPRYAVLETLAVLPEYRGRRIGHRLMEAIYERMRALGVPELNIVVVERNDDAKRFYEREGFLPWHVSYFGPIPDPPSVSGDELDGGG